MLIFRKVLFGSVLARGSVAGFGFTALLPGSSVLVPNDGPAYAFDLGPTLDTMIVNVTGQDSGGGVTFTGYLYSTVVKYDAAGHLAFGVFYHNDSSSPDPVERLTVSDFSGWLTSVANGDATFSAPGVPHAYLGTRSANGKVLGFNWVDGLGDGPIEPGEEGRFVWIKTDAFFYTRGHASVINSGVGAVETFAPTTPEPATAAVVVLGLGGLLRRRRR